MSIIRLHQMEFSAYHGYYKEEKSMRQRFMVNIDIDTDFSIAAKNDELEGTINYEVVYKICDQILNEPVSLIEHLAYKIGEKIKSEFKSINALKIEVQKRDVQLGGKLEYVSVVWEC